MLGTLGQYLAGHDNLKKVINSPALDHHGKLLSRDGSKVFTANSYNNRNGGNRFHKRRGQGNQQGNRKSNGGNKKKNNNNKNNQVVNS